MSWPQRFRARHGRPPRVLHVGNVANYAFVNASLMRRHGVEADVIDPDSYHIMAHPAWSEALISGDWGDDFNPSWARVDLGGYRAPDWFAQGPRDLVLGFAAARAAGDAAGAAQARIQIDTAVRRRARLLALTRRLRPALAAAPALTRIARGLGRGLVYGRKAPAASTPVSTQVPADPGLPPEITALRALGPALERALAGYDVVVGYALGAIYGLAARHPAVVACELGTLRGLPFEDTPAGRLCAWTYRNAAMVMITNADCVASAERLGIAEADRLPILHPFDLDTADAPAALPNGIADGAPYFLAPARQHWTGGSASFLKGNDVIIEAAARLAAQGRAFRLVFIEWGEDVAATRALIERHRLADRTIWLRPVCRRRLWPLYDGAVAVLDQFRAQALGGIGLESLARGRRLVSRYDEAAGELYFAEPPPLLAASDVASLAAAMAACLDDPDDRAGRGATGRGWMAQQHGIERQLAGQFAAFERLTERTDRRCA